VFEPKRDDITGESKKLYRPNIELHNMYSPPNIISMIKSRRMRLALHVACMGEIRNTKFLLESLKGTDESKDVGIDWRITLKQILRK
jgi:hypothetical protein